MFSSRKTEFDLLLIAAEFDNSFSPDRESSNSDRINIVLIGEWRVFIRTIGDFIIFDDLHLTQAYLVVNGELDPTSVLKLVERALR